MSEELERMARAMWEDDYKVDPDLESAVSWDKEDQEVRDAYLSNARAALLALREPTEGMKGAGARAFLDISPEADMSNNALRFQPEMERVWDRANSVAEDAFIATVDFILREENP